MRWRFSDPECRTESAKKAAITRDMDAWWEAFTLNADDIDAHFQSKKPIDIFAWMEANLSPIHEGIFWEYGPAVTKEGHRLVITPETRRWMRPMISELLRRAPHLERWEFYPYRLAENPAEARSYVKARAGREHPDASIRLARDQFNKIAFTLRSSAVVTPKDGRFDAMLFAEGLLGEESLDQWIGIIEALPPTEAASPKTAQNAGTFLPLDRAKESFEALKSSILEQLPDAPLHERSLDADGIPWTQYTCDPPPSDNDDYAGRDRQFFGTTTNMDLIRALIADEFSSVRFSRFGETFCYLKIDWSAVERSNVVEWREPFYHGLVHALRKSKVGNVCGTATGERYTFLDLAVTDVERAVEIVRATLRPLLVPQRAWLLFFDPEYAHEWVGIWDDTPPPMAREDGSVN